MPFVESNHISTTELCLHAPHVNADERCIRCKLCKRWIRPGNFNEPCSQRRWVDDSTNENIDAILNFPTKEVIDSIANAMDRIGLPYKQAAALCGIPEGKSTKWWRQGKTDAENGTLSSFSTLYTRAISAKANAYARHVATIEEASANGDVNAASAWLRSVDPDWNPRSIVVDNSSNSTTNAVQIFLPDNGRDQMLIDEPVIEGEYWKVNEEETAQKEEVANE